MVSFLFQDLGKSCDRLKDVYLIRGSGLTSNVYVIGKDLITTIDAGSGAYYNRLEPEFKSIGLRMSNVVQAIITHAHHDHANGLIELLQFADPKIFVFHRDARYLSGLGEHRIVRLEEGGFIETELFNLKIIHTPGHTTGSICLYDEKKKVLFSGDTVFPGGVFGNFPAGEGGTIFLSLEKLTKIDVDIILAGHGKPLYENGNQQIRKAFKTAALYI